MRRSVILAGLILISLVVAACGGSKPVTGESEVREGTPIVTSYAGQPLAIFFFHPF